MYPYVSQCMCRTELRFVAKFDDGAREQNLPIMSFQVPHSDVLAEIESSLLDNDPGTVIDKAQTLETFATDDVIEIAQCVVLSQSWTFAHSRLRKLTSSVLNLVSLLHHNWILSTTTQTGPASKAQLKKVFFSCAYSRTCMRMGIHMWL